MNRTRKLIRWLDTTRILASVKNSMLAIAATEKKTLQLAPMNDEHWEQLMFCILCSRICVVFSNERKFVIFQLFVGTNCIIPKKKSADIISLIIKVWLTVATYIRCKTKLQILSGENNYKYLKYLYGVDFSFDTDICFVQLFICTFFFYSVPLVWFMWGACLRFYFSMCFVLAIGMTTIIIFFIFLTDE